MTEQAILEAVQEIFRDNFDDDTLEITRAPALMTLRIGTAGADQPADRHREKVQHQIQAGRCAQPEKRWRPAGPGCPHGGLR